MVNDRAELLKKFKKDSANSESLHRLIEAYTNPGVRAEQRLGARNELERLVNGHLANERTELGTLFADYLPTANIPAQNASVGPQTSENELLQIAQGLAKGFYSRRFTLFVKHPYALIAEAHATKEENFAKNYLQVEPIHIGDQKQHNIVATYHQIYHSLGMAVGVLQERDVAEKEVVKIVQDMRKNLIAIVNEDYQGSDFQELRELFAAMYATTPLPVLKNQGLKFREIIEKRIGKLVPKEERAAYVRRTLEAHAKEGHRLFVKSEQASDEKEKKNLAGQAYGHRLAAINGLYMMAA